MKKYIEVNFIFLMFLIGMQANFAQVSNFDEIRYDSIKCTDIKFTIINYELSLYNVAYTFCTKNKEYIVINKKCNYQTTGIYFNDRRIEKLFGFQKDSIYSINLSDEEMDLDEQTDPLSYYSYVKFDKDSQTFNPQTFNHRKKIIKELNVVFQFNRIVDIDNKIYTIDKVFPFHTPPDFLLPDKIYPFYEFTEKGGYVVNRKFVGVNRYYRIIMNNDGSTILTPIIQYDRSN